MTGNEIGTAIKMMTFNLRYMNTNDEQSWALRLPVVRELLAAQQPDVIGTQEGLLGQIRDLERMLSGYGRIGEGREGGEKGEHVAVFYNKERLSVLDSGSYWLSDTPETAGSKTWGNTLPRMVTWVKFSEEATKQSFYFVNTHLDHISQDARLKGVQLINESTKRYDSRLPVVVTGDFNCTAASAPYLYLTVEGGFTDAMKASPAITGEELGTFHGFKAADGGGPGNRIDWILYRGNVEASSAVIDSYSKDGVYPSDHYPVIAELMFRAAEQS